jgi:hypothetical protein
MTSVPPPLASPPPGPRTSAAHLDALVDELAAVGADLPAELSVDERRSVILERLRSAD